MSEIMQDVIVDRGFLLNDILERTREMNNYFEALILVSREGLPVAAVITTTRYDEMMLSGMTAAAMSLAERVSSELNKGEIKETIINGEQGVIIIIAAGKEAVLSAILRSEAKIGLALLDLHRAARRVAKLL